MGSKNVRKLIWTLMFFATLLATCLPQTSYAQSGPALGGQPSEMKVPGLDPDQTRMILDATVQIYTIASSAGDGIKMQTGLGTLVNAGREALLVTHNHWDYLDQEGVVQFYEAQGSLLLEISMDEFNRSIVYQDKGTMVLEAPAGMVEKKASPSQTFAGANIGNAQTVPEGSIVYIAHHQPDAPLKVSLMAAEVVSVKKHKGVKTFNLKSLDGEVVVHGDSGGGLWYNGQLVGNTWLAYPEIQRSLWPGHTTETKEIYLDKATSAQLPENFLKDFASHSR